MLTRFPEWLLSLVLALAMPFAVGSPAAAKDYACEGAVAAQALFHPCPRDDDRDIILPLPAGLSMVLRASKVPGDGFWHDDARVIRLGNPNAPIYESPRVVSVAGTFPARDGKGWEIFLGKYEVSVAQFVAVMGRGNLDLGVRELLDRSRQNADGPALEAYAVLERGLQSRAAGLALASPVRGLSWHDYRAFIDTYTAWCLDTADCVRALPTLDGYPALFRLPSEVEWEYVARGGINPAADPPFDWTTALPFERSKAQLFSRVAPYSDRQASIIGRFAATNGYHDLFGNVRELTEDRFTSEPGQGRLGGYTLRGGGFRDTEQTLHAGQRREFAVYRMAEGRTKDGRPDMQLARPRDVGIRLALGTPVAATEDFQKRIAAEYDDYRRENQFASGVAQNGAPRLTRAANGMARIREILKAIRRVPANVEHADLIDAETKSIEIILAQEARKVTVELIEAAIVKAAEAGRTLDILRSGQEYLRLTEIEITTNERAEKRRLQGRERMRGRVQRLSARVVDIQNSYVEKIFEIGDYRAFVSEAFDIVREANFETKLDVSGLGLVEKHTASLLAGEQNVEIFKQELLDAFPE